MKNLRQIDDKDLGKRVFVYYNLHKHVWSIRDEKTKIVIGHCKKVVLKNVTYKVSEAGRQRVKATGQKNVHAGCCGILVSVEQDIDIDESVEISYNPYKCSTFFEVESKKSIFSDELIFMNNKKVWALRDTQPKESNV